MPMFDYDCPDCKARFDEIVKRADVIPSCPVCGGGRSARLRAVPAAIFGQGIRPDTAPQPARPPSLMEKYRGVDLSTVPYVTRDGSIAAHTGEILVKPNGDPAV